MSEITKIYVCGPTVYDVAHLGHAKVYITVDMINRIMNSIRGEKTILVMNITDIDDKIILKAERENKDWKEIAKTYEQEFLDSMVKLNVLYPNVIIRVSEVIPQIVAYIQKIIDNGFAYVTDDDSVYFDTKAYVNAGYSIDQESESDYTEVDVNLLKFKRDKRDFALWKGRKLDEIGFNVEFTYNGIIRKCYGRMGWHIECSTMIHETLGRDIKIHFGGVDLKFPHHNSERMQAHAYYHPYFATKQWSPIFMHIGHLCIKGKKMSKSEKNFTTINEELKRMTPNQIRLLYFMHKFSDPLDYEGMIMHAKIFDQTIQNFFERVFNYPYDRADIKYQTKEYDLEKSFSTFQKNILSSLSEFKFDIASSNISHLITAVNSYLSLDHHNKHLTEHISNWLLDLFQLLGFTYHINQSKTNVDDIMKVLIDTRTKLRQLTRDLNVSQEIKKKLFEILDEERNVKLKEIGISLQDTKTSSMWIVN